MLPARQRVTFIEHFIARGETLGHIARRYHVNQAMLLAANPKLNPRRIRIGQRVVVPTGGIPSTRVARRMSERGGRGRHQHRNVSPGAPGRDYFGVRRRVWSNSAGASDLEQSQRDRPDLDWPEASGGVTRRSESDSAAVRGRGRTVAHPSRAARGNARGPGETLRSLDPGPQESERDWATTPPCGRAWPSRFLANGWPAEPIGR